MLVSLASPLLRLSGRFQLRFCESAPRVLFGVLAQSGMRSFISWSSPLISWSLRLRSTWCRWLWDFLKFAITDTLNYGSAPDPSGGRGEMAMSHPRCARLFFLHRELGQDVGARCSVCPTCVQVTTYRNV